MRKHGFKVVGVMALLVFSSLNQSAFAEVSADSTKVQLEVARNVANGIRNRLVDPATTSADRSSAEIKLKTVLNLVSELVRRSENEVLSPQEQSELGLARKENANTNETEAKPKAGYKAEPRFYVWKKQIFEATHLHPVEVLRVVGDKSVIAESTGGGYYRSDTVRQVNTSDLHQGELTASFDDVLTSKNFLRQDKETSVIVLDVIGDHAIVANSSRGFYATDTVRTVKVSSLRAGLKFAMNAKNAKAANCKLVFEE